MIRPVEYCERRANGRFEFLLHSKQRNHSENFTTTWQSVTVCHKALWNSFHLCCNRSKPVDSKKTYKDVGESGGVNSCMEDFWKLWNSNYFMTRDTVADFQVVGSLSSHTSAMTALDNNVPDIIGDICVINKCGSVVYNPRSRLCVSCCDNFCWEKCRCRRRDRKRISLANQILYQFWHRNLVQLVQTYLI